MGNIGFIKWILLHVRYTKLQASFLLGGPTYMRTGCNRVPTYVYKPDMAIFILASNGQVLAMDDPKLTNRPRSFKKKYQGVKKKKIKKSKMKKTQQDTKMGVG